MFFGLVVLGDVIFLFEGYCVLDMIRVFVGVRFF